MDKMLLKDNTIERNKSVWVNWDILGRFSDAIDLIDSGNKVSKNFIFSYLDEIDEIIRIQNDQLLRSMAQKKNQIAQEQQIFDDKILVAQQKLAIDIATDNYLLAVKEYEVAVDDTIMAAKEYEAEVDREKAILEREKAELAVDKQEIELQKLQTQVITERYNQASVDVEVARYQLEAAKAAVQAIMANLEVTKAELDIIEADVKIKMAEADKAALRADIAMILAQVSLKELSETKLEVGEAKITSGYAYALSRLQDYLARYDTKLAEKAAKLAHVGAMTSIFSSYTFERIQSLELILAKAQLEADTARASIRGEREAANMEINATKTVTGIKMQLAEAQGEKNYSLSVAHSEARAGIHQAHQTVNEGEMSTTTTDETELMHIIKK